MPDASESQGDMTTTERFSGRGRRSMSETPPPSTAETPPATSAAAAACTASEADLQAIQERMTAVASSDALAQFLMLITQAGVALAALQQAQQAETPPIEETPA